MSFFSLLNFSNFYMTFLTIHINYLSIKTVFHLHITVAKIVLIKKCISYNCGCSKGSCVNQQSITVILDDIGMQWQP